MLGKDIIKEATKYLGCGASKFWKDYGLPRGSHWCCAFVWDIFRMCKASDLFYGGKKTAYVPTATIWLKANCALIQPEDAEAGDLVVFTWDGNGYGQERGSRDHIGFIEKRGNDKHIYTIEGNTGASSPSNSRVMRRIRDVKYVYGIYRPKYHSNAWYLRKKTKQIVKYMADHNFTYKASWKDNALSWDAAKKKRTTNCSDMISWAMQESGFIKKGIFWINGKKITCKGGLTLSDLKRVATISHPYKSPKKAHLHKGDICGYADPAHTQIFNGYNKNGEPLWFSTGGNADIKKGRAHVKKKYNKEIITTIIRLK